MDSMGLDVIITVYDGELAATVPAPKVLLEHSELVLNIRVRRLSAKRTRTINRCDDHVQIKRVALKLREMTK